MAKLTDKERKAREEPGGSNVGDYDSVKKGDFCGPFRWSSRRKLSSKY